MSTSVERWVKVPADRLQVWLDNFHTRHGSVSAAWDEDEASSDQLSSSHLEGLGSVRLEAADGAVAVLTPPFPLVPAGGYPVAALLDHVARPRRVGVLLVRKGGYAVGDFAGTLLQSSKTGSAYVQGRTKAGGWSQQRYARRRDQQAGKAYAGAAEAAREVLLPVASQLDAVVGGGDRGAVEAVLTDPRLAPLRPLVVGRVLPTPDPRLRVLRGFPEQFRAISVRLNDRA